MGRLFFVQALYALCIAASAASDVTFTGLYCHANITSPVGVSCTRQLKCCCNSTCAFWETGRLSLSLTASSSEAVAVAAPVLCEYDVPGKVNVSTSLVWLPLRGGCWTADANRLPDPLPFISPEQAYDVLRQTHVVVVGDSLLRQFFMRLVAHLRGFSEVVEHVFHADAFYASNGTYDLLRIACDDQENGTGVASVLHRGCVIPQHTFGVLSELEQTTVTVRFLWDPLFSGLRTDDIVAALGLEQSSGDSNENCVRRQRLLVVGMNHLTVENSVLAARANLSLGRFLGPDGDDECSETHVIWYAVPGANPYRNSAWVSERNSFFRAYLQAANAEAQQRGATSRAAVLPCDAMAADAEFTRGRSIEDLRWRCSLAALWGNVSSSQEANDDCADDFNLNLVHMTLMHVLALQTRSLRGKVKPHAECIVAGAMPTAGFGSSVLHLFHAYRNFGISHVQWDWTPSHHTCCSACENSGWNLLFKYPVLNPERCSSVYDRWTLHQNAMDNDHRGLDRMCEGVLYAWQPARKMREAIKRELDALALLPQPLYVMQTRGGDKWTEFPPGYVYNITYGIEQMGKGEPRGGTCVIVGDDSALAEQASSLSQDIIGCHVVNRVPQGNHSEEKFNMWSEEKRCVETKNVIIDIELLVRAKRSVGVSVSNVVRIASLLQQCRDRRQDILDWSGLNATQVSYIAECRTGLHRCGVDTVG